MLVKVIITNFFVKKGRIRTAVKSLLPHFENM